MDDNEFGWQFWKKSSKFTRISVIDVIQEN